MARSPNVLFFFTDDQRFDTIAALGNADIETPHYDALVARGTTFTRAHIPGGTCGAVCMPSRAMLHTGRSLFHLQDEGQEIPAAHTLLGEHLRAHGYESYGIGKWHNGRAAFARSFSDGDEIFFDGMADHWNVPAYRFDPTGAYDARLPFIANPQGGKEVTWRGADHIHAGAHSTDIIADAAARYLKQRNGGDPFFLYVSMLAPHDPRSMPARYREAYEASALPLPPNFAPEHAIDTGALRIRDEKLAAFPRHPEEIREHLADYYAMITHLDDALGRILAALEASGEADNTVIVVAGDNGLALGQHGLMGKQNLYDHSVRVPLLFAGPGMQAGARCDDLVYLHDIFPTLCDLASIPTPASVEGRSLQPALAENARVGRDHLYLAYADSIRGVTDGDHKLIAYASGPQQLFALRDDPHEQENRIDDPAFADLRARLTRMLCAEAEAWDDRGHRHGATFWRQREDLTAVV